MSTTGQLLYSALHGAAMRFAAERPDVANSIGFFAAGALDRDLGTSAGHEIP
jgi:hypothetical protein